MAGLSISRRQFLHLGAGALASPWLLRRARAAADYRLKPQPGQVHLVGEQYPKTPVWCYDGQVPGPEIRLRQGARLRAVLDNALDQDTTIHWHGIRLPNAMDGVPELTQAPVKPGEQFVYEFDLPDAGTYWYHPHLNSSEQVGRGLYGPLIVEERDPIRVDRDVTWVLDDWRLTQDASIDPSFGAMHDKSHGGRIGNVATLNGRIREAIPARAGERWRLRLINAANARSFSLQFEGHQPTIIAIDGQPVEPHEPADGRIVLGAAMRADVVIDMMNRPGERFRVIDDFFARQAYRLTDLVYSDESPLRENALDAPIRLPPNPLAEPDLDQARRFEMVFAGGAMGGMAGAMLDGLWTDIREMVNHGVVWAINGVAVTDPKAKALLDCKRGHSYVFALRNDTAFAHPMHLHGHAFRVIARDGRPTRHREWQDTVLVRPRERVDIAFVADNPGDWMFHCHILEHQISGMSGFIRVA